LGISGGSTSAPGQNKKLSMETIKGLPRLTPEDIEVAFSSVSSRLLKVKIASQVEGRIEPMINLDEKLVVLPSSVKNDPSGLGAVLIQWAQLHKLEIVIFNHEVSEEEDAIATTRFDVGSALFQAVNDVNLSVNHLTRSKTVKEEARKWVRAQMVVGALETLGKGSEILKKNNLVFGNNPGETYEVKIEKNQTSKIKVEYFKKTLEGLWREKSFSKILTDILVFLIKNAWSILTPTVLDKSIMDSLISYEEFIKIYCAHDVTREVKSGRRTVTETSRQVPSKPKANVMFLPEEQAILNELSAPIFGKTFYELNAEHWKEYLLGTPFKEIRKEVEDIYKLRGEYIRNFAALTTARLNQIRRLKGDKGAGIKKKDVSTTEVASLSLARDNPISKFADEVMTLDPTCSSFLMMKTLGIVEDHDKGSISQEAILMTAKAHLIIMCYEHKLYEGLEKTLEQAKKLDDISLSETALFDERKKLIQTLQATFRLDAKAKPKRKTDRIRFDQTELFKVRDRQLTLTLAASHKEKQQMKNRNLAKGVQGQAPVLTAEEIKRIEAQNLAARERQEAADKFKALRLDGWEQDLHVHWESVVTSTTKLTPEHFVQLEKDAKKNLSTADSEDKLKNVFLAYLRLSNWELSTHVKNAHFRNPTKTNWKDTFAKAVKKFNTDKAAWQPSVIN